MNTELPMLVFQKNLRRAMCARGMGPRALAKKSGVSVRTIMRMRSERWRTRLHLGTTTRIAQVLSVSPGDLVFMDPATFAGGL